MLSIWVAGIGAAIGSVVRFYTMELGKKVTHGYLPWPTLLINLSGAFALGLLSQLVIAPDWRIFIGTGLIGGFTTFSTFINEVIGLSVKQRLIAWGYSLLTIVIGIAFGFVGIYVGTLIK